MGFAAQDVETPERVRGDSKCGFTPSSGQASQPLSVGPTEAKARSLRRNGLDSRGPLAASAPCAVNCKALLGCEKRKKTSARLDSCSQSEAQRAQIVICILAVTGEGKRTQRKEEKHSAPQTVVSPGKEARTVNKVMARLLLDTRPFCN